MSVFLNSRSSMPMMDEVSPPTGAAFPLTRWTLVGRLHDDETRAPALSELCEIYWQPVFTYLRRMGISQADAEDRTQGFFAQLVEKETLAAADAARGRLRTFLLTALRRYCISEFRRESRQKRGGGMTPDELNGTETSCDPDPEAHFERQWALSLIGEAFRALERDYESSGKGELFSLINPFLEGRDPAGSSYEEIGEKLGMKPGAVQVAVYRLRKRYRQTFESVVEATLESREELQDELRHVLQILTG